MSEYQYGVTIVRFEDGEPVELIDQYITADDAITLMLHIKENIADAGEGDEEPEEETEEEDESHERRRPTYGPKPEKKIIKCSNCGVIGHNKRGCPKLQEAVDEDGNDKRSNRERVKELWEGGLDKDEIYERLPDIEMAEVNAIYDDLERKRHD